MKLLTINDNPTITDTIVFTIKTPDANGCFLADPYQINTVIIYFVERDFTSGNLNEYNVTTYDPATLQQAQVAQQLACTNPTPENIANAAQLTNQAQSKASINPFYYNEAIPVQIVGNDLYPAWLSTDLPNSFLEHITVDSNNNTIYGQFTYTWEPQGVRREGDYFICWTWTPLPAGNTMSANTQFSLKSNTKVTTTLPTHFTNPKKYPILLERYLPDMFKMVISSNDLTPTVLDNFNGAVAKGFTVLEDLANQIYDLQDANVLQEAMLPYLSNFFNLNLKTTDPTRWRGQIKRAIPLYKMKGTKKGLYEAMEHAAIKMLDLTQLWEVISSYTWQDDFTYDGTTTSFELEKVALPVDYENFGLWLREPNSNVWIPLSADYVEFITSDGVTTMIWVGNTLSVDPIDLIVGDEILVLYLYNEVPDSTAQAIENYIRSLPLMDQRDERDQIYPLKNWNVRVIAESDSMFGLVIPTRHPFHEPVIYGQVRTQFPYSENIYNADEYNGSLRNSQQPCDIDRNFVDPCTACISSCYNITLEIENLSDNRIIETQQVLEEFTPFHAVLHTFNFIGSVNEFIEPPLEHIQALVSVNGSECVIAGEGQMYFNRIMQLVETNGILRSDLAIETLAYPTTSGVAYNDEIVVFCPATKLEGLGISTSGANLHILSPSPLGGNYVVINPCGNVITVSPVPGSEPISNCNDLWSNNNTINTCAFTFDINNLVLNGTLCNIEQNNLFAFYDSTQNFGLIGVQSAFDVKEGTATNAWSVLIPAYSVAPYEILNIQPDGSLILNDNGTLPGNTTGIIYSILNGNTVIFNGQGTGNLVVTQRGLITVLSPSVQPIQAVVGIENYFFIYNNAEYPVIGFVQNTTNQFYVGNYLEGDNNSVNLQINKKILSGQIGYLSYRGLKLQMSGNLESGLGIQNGANSLVVVDNGIENNHFKENYIIVIGSYSYFMANIDGNSPSGYTTITLSGLSQYWRTLADGGTNVSATIYNYAKEGATIMGQVFNQPSHTFRTLDRAGRPIIDYTNQDGVVTGLSIPEDLSVPENMIEDNVKQKESITYSIQYADGTKEQGVV